MRQPSFELKPPGLSFEQAAREKKLAKAFIKAQNLLEKQTIDPNAFIGPGYPRQRVEGDLAKAGQLRKKFKKEGFEQQSRIFEAIVIDKINQGKDGWFGEGVRAIHTCEFDDYVNGVDVVLEMQESNQKTSHLALGVDVTCGERELLGKFLEIKKQIARGELGTVKYYRSSDGKTQGELNGISHVIIGTDGQHLEDLMRAWVNENSALSRDPIQMTFLAQILLQLHTFIEYAESKEVNQQEVATRLKQAQAKVQSIFERKMAQTRISASEVFQDRLVKAMVKALQVFKSNQLSF